MRQLKHSFMENLWAIVIVGFVIVLAGCSVLLIITRFDAVKAIDKAEDTSGALTEYIRCSQDFQTDLLESIDAQREVRTDIDNAIDRIVFNFYRAAVKGQDVSPEAFQRAIGRYVTLRQRQENKAEEKPLPELPKEVCGPVPAPAD